ncbi:ArsR/SmtB family transcription factor [Qipengyuania sp. ASV99]|uniref:ArsR/SmtB family transcription factor n=1 Tax=Qipengyuania sp. ASV99 TaxID=3399681 RepID=UPI003A4C7286
MSEAAIKELKAMAHPLRYRILEQLRGGELNVGEIEECSGIGQPALSQQLAILRKAGLVYTRKDAKLVYYRLDRDRLTQLGGLIGKLVPSGDAPAEPKRQPSPGAANFARLS